MKEALYYREDENYRIRCQLCPHNCLIPLNKTGFCRQRQNIKGRLYTLNYEQATSIHIDPIEKKPLYHFHPGSQVISLGTNGCNLACSFCQNWSILIRAKASLKKRHARQTMDLSARRG